MNEGVFNYEIATDNKKREKESEKKKNKKWQERL